jgi:hypothetical protein
LERVGLPSSDGFVVRPFEKYSRSSELLAAAASTMCVSLADGLDADWKNPRIFLRGFRAGRLDVDAVVDDDLGEWFRRVCDRR